MSEHFPDDRFLAPDAALDLRHELNLQQDMMRFKATLTPDQQVDFEEIFSPIGQIQLHEAYDNSGQISITRFGLFPAENELTPAQHSTYALIAAYTEEQIANNLSQDPKQQAERLAEAARLKQLAKKVRAQAE
jgi:hypothetical protein